jgi:hypothetical protein
MLTRVWTRVVSSPVETRYGVHLIRVARCIEGRQLPFEAVRNEIATFLEECRSLSRPMDALEDTWMDREPAIVGCWLEQRGYDAVQRPEAARSPRRSVRLARDRGASSTTRDGAASVSLQHDGLSRGGAGRRSPRHGGSAVRLPVRLDAAARRAATSAYSATRRRRRRPA